MSKTTYFLLGVLVVAIAIGAVLGWHKNAEAPIVDDETVSDSVTDGVSDDTENTDEQPPVGIVPFDSGVMGTVLLGPVCPVMREGDESCNDKPYATEILVFSAGNDKTPFSTGASETSFMFRNLCE